MPICFLKNWTIDLTKIPAYSTFKSTFGLELDHRFLEAMFRTDHPEFTPDRKAALQPLLENINKRTNVLQVTHSPRFEIGRFYPDNNISPIVLSRHLKHTLFTHLNWIDIDMVKGHATIIYEVAKNNNFILESFKRYITDFDEVTSEIINFYAAPEEPCLTQENVKTLFNLMIYGGGVNNWFTNMQEEGVVFKTRSVHPFISSFKAECDNMITMIYVNNPQITNRVKGDETEEYKLKNKTMSYFCQTIENELIYIVCKVLLKHKVIKPKSFALEFDGICFKRPSDESINLDIVLEEVNSTIFSKTQLNVIMKWKGYSPDHIHIDLIQEVSEPSERMTQLTEEIKNDIEVEHLSDCDTYLQFKNIFEKTHFKCRSTACYYNEDRFQKSDGSIELSTYTEHALRTAYRDYNYKTPKGKTKYYIDEWFDDSRMRAYDNMRCVPPPLICPPNVYNTWYPFSITSCTALEKDENGKCIIPEEISEELEHKYTFVCNHIKAMCGHDPIAYDYLMYWFGFLLLCPAEKSSMPSIIGAPGSGKSEMINLLISLIGESRCLVTSKPQDDVWGQFNSLIAHKYLVLLEELSEKQTIEFDGVIKDLITGGRLTVNTKGVKQYTIDSYLKMIALSNTITCKTITGDRRNVLIKCSNEFVGNVEYFETLREYQADKRVQMLFYERLINLPDLENFRKKPIPVTAYQKIIQNSNREDFDLFMEDWVTANTGIEIVNIKSKYLYDSYVLWVKSNEALTKPSGHSKFTQNITLFLGDIITPLKTNSCNRLKIDVPRLMAKYNISLMQKEEDSELDEFDI